MSQTDFVGGISAFKRKLQAREFEHMRLRQQAIRELRCFKAQELVGLGVYETAVFHVLMFEIEREGYCPTDLDFLAIRARVTRGYAARALCLLGQLGVIEEFGEERSYACLADGPWLPPESPALNLNRSPYDDSSGW